MPAIAAPMGAGRADLLLLQVALLLLVARLGGEAAKRASLPAVVGELAAGILLGPTCFGHFLPGAFTLVFPTDPGQFRLLETVSTLGMVLLLMLTGLETDVRLLRNLGRPAMISSAFGMVLPFAMGFGLGMLMPEAYVAQPDRRVLFSFFVATAMSISAMPVIAKILMDLDLTRRNIGLVILSAGVVDDTTGWLILSVIAGAATSGGADVAQLAMTIGWTLGFIGVAFLALYPLRALFRIAADNFRTKDSDLVLIAAVTMGCAAATERIGVHAVFGAFIAGVVMRQVPRLRQETVHKLESVTMAVFAPVFFGVVGLKVDLWKLEGGTMFAIVLGVATLSKMIGCTVGARWGGLGLWESLSIAVAMNARGAMELVVASIGLSLGLLNQPMFSIIVLVAITTSFMAPLGLRLTMRRVKLTDEERERLLAEQARGFFDPKALRVLMPTGGGPNALPAARIALTVARGGGAPLSVLYVDPVSSFFDRVLTWLRLREKHAGLGIDADFAAIRALAPADGQPSFSKVADRQVVPAILTEAGKGYDLIVLGASAVVGGLSGSMLEDLVEGAPCHLAVMMPVGDHSEYKHLLVPLDGSVFSRAAVDFAVLLAEKTGAAVTLLFLSERRPQAVAWADLDSSTDATWHIAQAENPQGLAVPLAKPTSGQPALSEEDAMLERISNVFKASKVKPTILARSYDPLRSAVAAEARSQKYDLIVVGAENRAIRNRLFFGYENERLLKEAPVSVLMIVPKIDAGKRR